VRPIASFWKKPGGEGADALRWRGDRWLLQREIKLDLIACFSCQAFAFLRDDRGSGQRRNNVAHDARCIEHFTRARETLGGGIGRNAVAGGSSGGGQIWPGWNRPGNVAAIGADLA
jgi:hypothetical protein